MTDKQETIADIIAEMDRVEVCADGEPCLRDYARRFKAAWKREKSQSWHHREMEELILQYEKEVAELKKLIPQPDPDWKAVCEKCHDGEIEPKCEYYGEPNGCNSPIYGEHPSTPDAAAMHSCLIKILSEMIDLGGMERGRKACFSPDAIAEEIRQALAVMPRNCDRFASAEEAWDAYDEWAESYRAKGKTEPLNEVGWLFATATEKKGENNGR